MGSKAKAKAADMATMVKATTEEKVITALKVLGGVGLAVGSGYGIYKAGEAVSKADKKKKKSGESPQPKGRVKPSQL